jgi:hypothetical protein
MFARRGYLDTSHFASATPDRSFDVSNHSPDVVFVKSVFRDENV